nr:MAG TPA: hypothetical protein [Caudoviricetes sp.]DAU82375.1 MAG TPA: hypothetical protein [Bacteriophage sp.]DAV96486.1 MAG TPA: hypothetical protein [Caudoviricetes sp.]DAW65955.1 MAG TPA: hypothetical protein [Bacteriophage sp.]DAW74574.1 MAG TPA: hypothetical protein [Caudoviricetes sp.]
MTGLNSLIKFTSRNRDSRQSFFCIVLVIGFSRVLYVLLYNNGKAGILGSR